MSSLLERSQLCRLLLIGSLLLFFSATSRSEDNWAFSTTLQGTIGDYRGSEFRNNISSAGILFGGDYRDRAGLTLGYEYSHVDFDSGFTNNIYGSNLYASGKVSVFPDWLPGKITTRLDFYFNDNQDSSDFSDEVRVWAPQVSFLNHTKTFYADFGYARSSYKKELFIRQYTPTLGIGVNQGFDWIQARGYFINPSNPSRVQGSDDTEALEVKWTHWLSPDNFLKLNNFQLGYVWGKRIHPVDQDAAAVYSLGDTQTDATAFGLEWKLPQDMSFMVLAARAHYRQRTLNDNYANDVLYLSVAKKW
ncbi:MAG: hypothetical protein HY559_04520 [Gammaproteobacteria bacterium]|nr:hypothetical protein [Gammaproteobacteria bacterium]